MLSEGVVLKTLGPSPTFPFIPPELNQMPARPVEVPSNRPKRIVPLARSRPLTRSNVDGGSCIAIGFFLRWEGQGRRFPNSRGNSSLAQIRNFTPIEWRSTSPANGGRKAPFPRIASTFRHDHPALFSFAIFVLPLPKLPKSFFFFFFGWGSGWPVLGGVPPRGLLRLAGGALGRPPGTATFGNAFFVPVRSAKLGSPGGWSVSRSTLPYLGASFLAETGLRGGGGSHAMAVGQVGPSLYKTFRRMFAASWTAEPTTGVEIAAWTAWGQSPSATNIFPFPLVSVTHGVLPPNLFDKAGKLSGRPHLGKGIHPLEYRDGRSTHIFSTRRRSFLHLTVSRRNSPPPLPPAPEQH